MSAKSLENKSIVHTIDLNFKDKPGAIAAYLIPHSRGGVLVESGPASTIPALITGIQSYGLSVEQITDVFVTHIHLDHAGASGWLARQGARVHVHPQGAPHLVDPEKLLASASRLYGDEMHSLWGDFLPVPEAQIRIPQDGEETRIDGLRIKPLDTPGHAYHHYTYLSHETCFTGDICGARMADTRYLRLPMPPPELHLGLWRDSLTRLRGEFDRGSFNRLALTHFGLFDDPEWHLSAVEGALDAAEEWTMQVMPSEPPIEEIRARYIQWEEERTRSSGIELDQAITLDIANGSWMSAYGINRYWHKVLKENGKS